MKKMIIFEPAMCCSTGVCGPGVDPELLRISTVINTLKSKGIEVERHNLSNNPQIFIENKTINELVNSEGVEALPAVMINNEIVKTKTYPSNEEICNLLGIPQEELNKKDEGCGCSDGCC